MIIGGRRAGKISAQIIIARELADSGARVTVFVPDQRYADDLSRRYGLAGVPNLTVKAVSGLRGKDA